MRKPVLRAMRTRLPSSSQNSASRSNWTPATEDVDGPAIGAAGLSDVVSSSLRFRFVERALLALDMVFVV